MIDSSNSFIKDASLSIMKTIARIVAVAAFFVVRPLPAQVSHGYAFMAPGHESNRGSFGHAGVGGEWLSRLKIGIGAEVGYLWGRQFSPSLAVISGNAVFHIPLSGSRLDAFVTLGATLLTNGSGAAYATNYGGGANYWFLPRLGARLEFRDHYWHGDPIHLTEFRFGLSFH
jgi:hypothetical protein